MSKTAPNPRRVIRRLNLLGFALIVLLVGGIGGWAATSQLAGAVIASGTLVVESSVKKVQHPTGGIVGEILVKEGSTVEAGQIVIRLDDTVTEGDARRGALAARRGARARGAPAGRTRWNRTAGVSRGADEPAEREDGRRGNRRRGEAVRVAPQRAGRTEARSCASASRRATRRSAASPRSRTPRRARSSSSARSWPASPSSIKQNLVTIVRYSQLQRDQARLEGERGQFIAEIARARGKISETELQILQLDQDFRTEVLKDLRDTQGKIAELRERVIAAEDQLKRVDIRAPQTGIVHQLAVHTVGGVIANGETIMLIVPRADELVVEAKVAPQDIDQITIGAATTARIMAGNQRTTPEIAGRIIMIAADLSKEQQTNQTYYLVRATLPEDQVRLLEGLKLLPGMPVEMFIQTQDRTPLEFLLKPLRDQFARTFRER